MELPSLRLDKQVSHHTSWEQLFAANACYRKCDVRNAIWWSHTTTAYKPRAPGRPGN